VILKDVSARVIATSLVGALAIPIFAAGLQLILRYELSSAFPAFLGFAVVLVAPLIGLWCLLRLMPRLDQRIMASLIYLPSSIAAIVFLGLLGACELYQDCL